MFRVRASRRQLRKGILGSGGMPPVGNQEEAARAHHQLALRLGWSTKSRHRGRLHA